MAEVTDERLAFLIGAPDWENTHLGDEVEAALTELQARRAAEAKAVEALRKIAANMNGLSPRERSDKRRAIALAALGARND